MKSLPVFNPQSRFVSTSLDYDEGEVPNAEYTVYEDDTKNILASNDSPDVGFRFSVNPYRGCLHACAYCLHGSTPILMADGSTRALEDVRVGDAIYGTIVFRGVRRYAKTHVIHHFQTMKRAHRVRLADGTQIIASDDHRFLASRGDDTVFTYVARPARQAKGESARVLAPGDVLHGVGAFTSHGTGRSEPIDDDYRSGYLDGWAACAVGFQVSVEMLRRIRVCLISANASTPFFGRNVSATEKRLLGRAHLRVVEPGASTVVATSVSSTSPALPDRSAESRHAERTFTRGWLAAIFDALAPSDLRGVLLTRRSVGTVRFGRLAGDVLEALRKIGLEGEVRDGVLRVCGGLREELRFLSLVAPCNGAKWSFSGARVDAGSDEDRARLVVESVEDLGFHTAMVDITTGTEDFIANGVVSHNCYARPSHEYLSLGAGTDFERKIVVKKRAPELLRDAFDKKSWKGELVVFSGITDCYQPLERELRLTRGCLQVCAEYKNPVGIITKSPVIERDIDLLQELARVTSLRVHVSVPFWDPDAARAMEPMVTTPERRMKIIETLAKAGLKVGVSVSPIVPGLNDEHLGDVLERAANAGATNCFFVLLRLPGPVKDVFERALRDKLPLRAEKVLNRMREAHGGKLYDSRFGQRQHGRGPYAETIAALFARTAKRYGLDSGEMDSYGGEARASTFERPLGAGKARKAGQTSFGF